jgi:hypothetical protein
MLIYGENCSGVLMIIRHSARTSKWGIQNRPVEPANLQIDVRPPFRPLPVTRVGEGQPTTRPVTTTPYNPHMKPVHDSASFYWILEGRSPAPHSADVNAASGVKLSCVIPLKFEKYVKILHRLEGHYENIDRPLCPDETAILAIRDCAVDRNLVIEKRSSGWSDNLSNDRTRGSLFSSCKISLLFRSSVVVNEVALPCCSSFTAYY